MEYCWMTCSKSWSLLAVLGIVIFGHLFQTSIAKFLFPYSFEPLIERLLQDWSSLV